ncbi:MAG: peptidase domain-containing ABC transporter [Ignavibacteria bacterium]|nr:peptidase domain-containing ABC transporter [Ignavibacteria bacterium]
MRNFPIYRQLDETDCGPACLKILSLYYNLSFDIEYLRDISVKKSDGISVYNLMNALKILGFNSLTVKASVDTIESSIELPAILHWNDNHFVVLYKISRKFVYISDPAFGRIKYTIKEFESHWLTKNSNEGILIIIEKFELDQNVNFSNEKLKSYFKLYLNYLHNHFHSYLIIFILLILGSIFIAVSPKLTQMMVDHGISKSPASLIINLFIAQLIIIVSSLSVEVIKNKILLKIGTKININIISKYLIKLMKLPISFYDTKGIGDLLQRITDNFRIQSFLTNSIPNFIYSILTIIIFGVVLFIFNSTIFFFYLIFTILSTVWVLVFMKARKVIDYKRFNNYSENQKTLVQIIYGMKEIKLNGIEESKQNEWQQIQNKIYDNSKHILKISQYQTIGNRFITQTKNLIILYFCIYLINDNTMSIGTMFAISFIVGQLNSPIDQAITFLQNLQDANLSLERLNEIHLIREESESCNKEYIISEGNIKFNKVSFRYNRDSVSNDLHEINFSIPQNKVTAIVGYSGGGKSTLLKLLLKFYDPESGSITVDDKNLQDIDSKYWRKKCGAVMQDGYIFSDSILNNIVMNVNDYDKERLEETIHISCLDEFVSNLQFGLNTKIGEWEHGLSMGQKQRILIARIIYKNPSYIFLDEATSNIDARTESNIIQNVKKYLNNKTMLIISHRFSTISHADQIVVIGSGKISEIGTHSSLLNKKGDYFSLMNYQTHNIKTN